MESMDVNDVVEFARDVLKQSERICECLEEGEVDGVALNLINVSNVKLIFPEIPAGFCLKFLDALEKYKANAIYRNDSDESHQSSVDNSGGTIEQVMCLLKEIDEEKTPNQLSISTPPKSPHTIESSSISSKKKPYSGDFPINSVCFGPFAIKAMKDGIVTRSAKEEILSALHAKVLELSSDKIYGDRHIRQDAASLLVLTFDTLREGRSIIEATAKWRESLVAKGKNYRRKLDKTIDPRLQEYAEKYKNKRRNSQNFPHQELKRQIVEPLGIVQDDSNTGIMEVAKKSLQEEMLKAPRERDPVRLVQLMNEAFPLRHEEISSSEYNMSDIIFHWPALEIRDCMADDLAKIGQISRDALDINLAQLASISNMVLRCAESGAKSVPRSHPLVHLLSAIDHANSEGRIALALSCLPYLLPGKKKKTISDFHRYLIDVYPSNTSPEEIASHVLGRQQPFIVVEGGALNDPDIYIIGDGVKFTSAKNTTDAVLMMMGLHFIMNAEYNEYIRSAMKFIEYYVLGFPLKSKHESKEVMSLWNTLNLTYAN